MAGNIEIEVNGEKYAATFEVSRGIVTVNYDGRKNSTQVGGSPPESIARILLSELINVKS